MTTAKRKPTLMGNYSDDELDQKVIDHAKYFTVIQVNRGGFVGGGKNYNRFEYPTFEQAKEEGEKLYKAEGKSILVYAVADFSGAMGLSRPVASFPPSTWMSKADKERLAKKKRAEARKAAKQSKATI